MHNCFCALWLISYKAYSSLKYWKILFGGVRDWKVMLNHLNIVKKESLSIMAKLYKEAETTKAHPSLNMPPHWNFGLWVELPQGTWGRMTWNVTLLSNYLRSREK